MDDLRVEALTLPPFSLLTVEQQSTLALCCHLDSCQPQDVVALAGEPLSELLVVVSGRLCTGSESSGSVENLKCYEPGDLLGSLTPVVQERTILAQTTSLVLRVPQEPFFAWLRSHEVPHSFLKQLPGLSQSMLAHLNSRPQQKKGLLTDDEHTLFEFATSEWVVLTRLLWPLLGLLISLGAGVVDFFYRSNSLLDVALFGAFVSLFWGVGVLIWGQLNLLLVTNKAVILRQVHFSPLKIQHTRILREEIRSLKIVRSGWASKLFSVVTVELATEGSLERFAEVPYTKEMEEFLGFCQPWNVQEFNEQDLREILEETVGDLAVPKRLFWAQIPLKEQLHRRHPAYLVARLAPGFFLLLLLVGLDLLGSSLWPRGSSTLTIFLALVSLIPLLSLATRFWSWKQSYIKWSGDRLVVHQQSPWRWRETSGESQLSQLQEVRVAQTSWWEMLMDVGTLKLYFGAEDPLIVEGLSHPSRIQAELFRAKESDLQQTRRNHQKQRYQEVAKLLKVWKQFAKRLD